MLDYFSLLSLNQHCGHFDFVSDFTHKHPYTECKRMLSTQSFRLFWIFFFNHSLTFLNLITIFLSYSFHKMLNK